jgi:hypothetical protein
MIAKPDLRFLTDTRKRECREAAHQVLRKYHIESPEAIDLDSIAWFLGRLKIKIGGLSGAEGRIIAGTRQGGIIRVGEGQNRGRCRFTIAHELGHYVLHRGRFLDATETRAHFTVWNDASEESEANFFAAELLMPDYLFKPLCRKNSPSLQLVDGLASTFQTSLLATCFQFHEYTNRQVALIVSDGWDVKIIRPFEGGFPRIRRGRIHEHSAAGERLLKKSPDSRKMVRTPLYAWCDGFDDKPSRDVWEDSLYLDWYDRTVTLLWLRDE